MDNNNKSERLKRVSYKLENLPENLLREVDLFIDYLTEEESSNIPQWQQSIVLDRIENSTEFVDAFEMLAQLNPDSAFAQYYE
ncbi:hypothetical protein [Myroides profundi]|uniref:DUF2281 domain-containing protein n=1 Tax=Myroides profundi TaxID=480520 RepID=A0AAJ4W5D2_MYRPR|nr:hypothetical protein [Myroides profundi]AJH15183.1 hypothetical protein MPR_2012 [Myroides profundi]SER23305.1 hypothetical protein SAMN04488089_11174 [Myroides profundi]